VLGPECCWCVIAGQLWCRLNLYYFANLLVAAKSIILAVVHYSVASLGTRLWRHYLLMGECILRFLPFTEVFSAIDVNKWNESSLCVSVITYAWWLAVGVTIFSKLFNLANRCDLRKFTKISCLRKLVDLQYMYVQYVQYVCVCMHVCVYLLAVRVTA
jgi:hypothetical protein